MRTCKLFIFYIGIVIFFFSCKRQGDVVSIPFVTIEDNHFQAGDGPFFPMMLNYMVSLHSKGSQLVVAPSLTYDSCNYADAVARSDVKEQMLGHFVLIKELGVPMRIPLTFESGK